MIRRVPYSKSEIAPDYLFADNGIATDPLILNLTSKVGLRYTINSSVNITIGELPEAGNIGRITVEFINGGNYPIVWDANIKFADGDPPSLSSDNKVDRLMFICEDGIHVECHVIGLNITRN